MFMNKNMKYLSLLFIAILYFNPTMLAKLTSSILGKAILLVFIMTIGHLYGKKATLFASVIALLLLEHSNSEIEGMENKEEVSISAVEETKDKIKDALFDIKGLEAALNGGTSSSEDQVGVSDQLRTSQSSKDVSDVPGANNASPDLATGETDANSEVKPNATTVTEGFSLF